MEKQYFKKANYSIKRRNYTEAIEHLVDTIKTAQKKKEGEALAVKAEKTIVEILMTRAFR